MKHEIEKIAVLERQVKELAMRVRGLQTEVDRLNKDNSRAKSDIATLSNFLRNSNHRSR